jgi:hypothetical protein
LGQEMVASVSSKLLVVEFMFTVSVFENWKLVQRSLIHGHWVDGNGFCHNCFFILAQQQRMDSIYHVTLETRVVVDLYQRGWMVFSLSRLLQNICISCRQLFTTYSVNSKVNENASMYTSLYWFYLSICIWVCGFLGQECNIIYNISVIIILMILVVGIGWQN